MMLGKTVLDETHPQFIGLYQGDRSREYVRRRIETADCVLELGALATDFNTGGFTVQLFEERTIRANIRSVKIKHHIYPPLRWATSSAVSPGGSKKGTPPRWTSRAPPRAASTGARPPSSPSRTGR